MIHTLVPKGSEGIFISLIADEAGKYTEETNRNIFLLYLL